jgi:putative transposase
MRCDLALPEFRSSTVRDAVVRAVSLAHWGIIHTRSWAADSPLQRVRLASKLEAARAEIALLREEVRIKDARWAAIPPKRRPHYSPQERMAILTLRAARGWSSAQTARAFLLEPETIASWTRRIDETGANSLVQLATPVNKFPEFVEELVRILKTVCPAMGKKRIAHLLAQAGLQLSATTAGRMLKRQLPSSPSDSKPPEQIPSPAHPRTVTAKYPNHVWHVDLTAVPTVPGFWVPWLPFSLPQVWPFCWWVVAAVDHFSRRLIATRVYTRPPTAEMICRFLDATARGAGSSPRYIVSDKGTQFWSKKFKTWCRGREIRLRFGAVGRYGSIAIVERFFRSLKTECTRRLLVPLRISEMRHELALYRRWYNRHRPHQSLRGIPPEQLYLDSFGCREGGIAELKLFEGDAPRHRKSLRRVDLGISYLGGRRHLPIIQLRNAA